MLTPGQKPKSGGKTGHLSKKIQTDQEKLYGKNELRRFVELVILGIGKILIKNSTVRKIIFWWMKFEKTGWGPPCPHTGYTWRFLVEFLGILNGL